jgi:SAM-dependent methyltransferase
MGDREKAIVAAGYDEIVEGFGRWSARVVDPVRDQLFEAFVGMLPAGAAVLDIGCGAGIPWTVRLAARYEVTGIDISAGQVAAARRNVPGAAFVVGDVATAELDAHAFDGAVALYSLGHLPREEHGAVLERIGRWLHPGGLLLASLPAVESAGWTGSWLGTTMFFASLGTDAYRSLLRDLGYEAVHFEEATAMEPEGPARFLWVLARVAGR